MFDMKSQWRDQKAEEFLYSVKGLLKNESYAFDVASALAYNHHNRTIEESTQIMDSHNLKDYHAICFLDYISDRYKEEVDQEFNEYLKEY